MPYGLHRIECMRTSGRIRPVRGNAYYGIPQGQASIRRQLCWLLKSHGLQSIDRGGSVYLGPENKNLDVQLRRLVDALREKTGASNLVNIFVGEYDGLTAKKFVDAVTKNALEDLKDSEVALAELERALAGEVEILNADNKPVNLVSTGYGRLDSAKSAIITVDSVLARFQGSQELEKEGVRLRTKLAQIQAWTERVQVGYDRYCKAHKKEAA